MCVATEELQFFLLAKWFDLIERNGSSRNGDYKIRTRRQTRFFFHMHSMVRYHKLFSRCSDISLRNGASLQVGTAVSGATAATRGITGSSAPQHEGNNNGSQKNKNHDSNTCLLLFTRLLQKTRFLEALLSSFNAGGAMLAIFLFIFVPKSTDIGTTDVHAVIIIFNFVNHLVQLFSDALFFSRCKVKLNSASFLHAASIEHRENGRGEGCRVFFGVLRVSIFVVAAICAEKETLDQRNGDKLQSFVLRASGLATLAVGQLVLHFVEQIEEIQVQLGDTFCAVTVFTASLEVFAHLVGQSVEKRSIPLLFLRVADIVCDSIVDRLDRLRRLGTISFKGTLALASKHSFFELSDNTHSHDNITRGELKRVNEGILIRRSEVKIALGKLVLFLLLSSFIDAMGKRRSSVEIHELCK
mmetsp:Transcript_4191/g.8478  ORF Transcript_4191/g.8478 Transcript_4191/m.8478 type:complete len:414 (+) Transcript_4191:38-1279(+)